MKFHSSAVALALVSAGSVSCQDFEISPDVLFAGSPVSMLFTFIGGQDDVLNVTDVFKQVPFAAQTKDLHEQILRTEDPSFTCDLTDIDPACFLVNIAGQLGAVWGTKELDEGRTMELISRYLISKHLTLNAALMSCILSPAILPLLATFGTDAGTPTDVIGRAKEACLMEPLKR